MATPYEHTKSIYKKLVKIYKNEPYLYESIYHINEAIDAVKLADSRYSARILTHQTDIAELVSPLLSISVNTIQPTLMTQVIKEHCAEDYMNIIPNICEYFDTETLEIIDNDSHLIYDCNRYLNGIKKFSKIKYRTDSNRDKTIRQFFEQIVGWISNTDATHHAVLRTLLISHPFTQYAVSMLLKHNLKYMHGETERLINIRDMFLDLNRYLKQNNIELNSILDIKQNNKFVKNGLGIKQK